MSPIVKAKKNKIMMACLLFPWNKAMKALESGQLSISLQN